MYVAEVVSSASWPVSTLPISQFPFRMSACMHAFHSLGTISSRMDEEMAKLDIQETAIRHVELCRISIIYCAILATLADSCSDRVF